jgi:hypothetical protein
MARNNGRFGESVLFFFVVVVVFQRSVFASSTPLDDSSPET